jgi:hypothetical protein
MAENGTLNDAEKANYEAGLRKRLELLRVRFEEGKLKFAPDLKVTDSLAAVRLGSDGEIDLSTVDGSVRALAAAVAGAEHYENARNAISLSDLQRGYFETVHKNFSHLYDRMKQDGMTAAQVGRAITADPDAPRQIGRAVTAFCEWAEDLWKDAQDSVYVHVADIKGVKAVFGGETFPQGRNAASYAGVYTDTVVLPEPFIRNKHFLQGGIDSRGVGEIMKSAMLLLKYREAAVADLDVPLVVVVPDRSLLSEEGRKCLFESSAASTLAHINALFGSNFSNLNEAESFLKGLATPADVLSRLSDADRLLFEDGDTRPKGEQLTEYIETYINPYFDLNAGEAVNFSAVGRMAQATDLLQKSGQLGGVPLIDAPTSWRYYNWRLAYGSSHMRGNEQQLVDLHMTKALRNAAGGEMQWLGAVPVASLIEMRKQGVLPELREVLAKGVEDLTKLRPDNFFRTSDQVVKNIQDAFEDHQKKLSTFRGKKWKFAGVELASCVVKGAVQVASALGVPGVSLIGAAMDQAMDVPKAKDIPKRYRALVEEKNKLNKSAVGLMFSASKKAERAGGND